MFSIGTLIGVIGAAVGIIGLILGYSKKNSDDNEKAANNGQQNGVMLTQIGAANKSLDDIKLDMKRECEKRQDDRVETAKQFVCINGRLNEHDKDLGIIFNHISKSGQYDNTDLPPAKIKNNITVE